MNIIRKSPDKYGLHKVGKNCHRIVKILREYDNEQQAVNDLTELMLGEIMEEELISGGLKHMKTAENYFKDKLVGGRKEDADTGKLGNRINVLEAALEGIRDGLIHAMGDGDNMEGAVRETIKRISELVEGGKEG